MAKKSFAGAGGIDALIQPTVKKEQPIKKEEDTDVGIYLKIPMSTKRKIDVYCAEKGLKKNDFFNQLIDKFFKDK